MQRVFHFLNIFFISLFVNAQVFNQAIADETQRVDSVINLLVEYENFGPKPTGSPALVETLEWIVNKYEYYGYSPVIDTFKIGSNESYNIII